MNGNKNVYNQALYNFELQNNFLKISIKGIYLLEVIRNCV